MKDADLDSSITVWPLNPYASAQDPANPQSLTIRAEALQGLKVYAGSSLSCEMGGLLVGSVLASGTAVQIEISGYLSAEAVEPGPAHLWFTHEAWQGMRKQRQTEYPDELVIGWFHTYPQMGIFLSEPDRDLHAWIFRWQPWAVALVLDPVIDHHLFFWLNPQGMPCQSNRG